jgi:hypothetical protein
MEAESPWKTDIARMEHTLQEALRAISRLSGVELSPAATNSHDEAASPSGLDSTTLKDQIRNDLAAFSETTVSQMARQAQLQARAALASIQNEVSGQIDQVIGECRIKLQEQIEPQQLEIDVSKQSQDRIAELVQTQTDEFARWVWLVCKGTGTPIPLQIEKLLEPYVEEATSRVTGSIQQKLHDLLAEQEKLFQDRYQGTTDSLESRISTIEQTARQICEQNADSVTKLSKDRLNAAADDVAKSIEGRIREQVDGSVAGIQTRLDETAGAFLERLEQEQEQRAQGFIRRMEALASEAGETKAAEISTRIGQAATEVAETSLLHLHQRAQDLGEHSEGEWKAFLQRETEGILRQIQEAGRSVHESVEQDAALVTDRLKGLDQEIAGIREKYLADSQGQISYLVQEAMGSIEPRIQQLAHERMIETTEAVRKSQDESVAQFELRLREVSEGQYRNLLERIQREAGEAGAQIAVEVRNASQSALQELSDKVSISASFLREQQEQASSKFQASVNDTLETFRQQLAQITEAGREEQRKSITDNITALQFRLQRAADLLVAGLPTTQ